MAAGYSVPPIELSKAAAAASKRRRARGFGAVATAAWACLLGMGASQPGLRAQGAEAAPHCSVEQKKPLFVGFAEGMGLDSFEASALAAREIVREIKHWACDDDVNASAAVPSLQLAFAKSESLRLELLQFDDAELARAHVVLTEAPAGKGPLQWRVDLALADSSGWTVTRTRIATAADQAAP